MEQQDHRLDPAWSKIQPRHVFTIGVLLFIFMLLYLARGALGPYILAIAFSYFLLPVVTRIEGLYSETGWQGRIRRPLATLLSLFLLFAALVLLMTFLVRPVIRELTALADAFPEYWEALTEGRFLGDWYVENVPEEARAWIDERTGELGQRLLEAATSLIEFFFATTGTIVGALVALVIVPVFMAYFLIDRPNALGRVERNLPAAWADDAVEILRMVDGTMAAYTKGVFLSSLVVGVITAVGYRAIGIELWIALAMIAFLGEIIPILGPWIAFFISFPIILATQPDRALFAVALFGIIQALEGWFIAPKIQGHAIELPPSMALVALAIGGATAGALGVVLALPVAAILREIIIYIMRRLDGVPPALASKGLTPDSRGISTEDIEPADTPDDE
jgi:predicted PurR-regulated permease PerM